MKNVGWAALLAAVITSVAHAEVAPVLVINEPMVAGSPYPEVLPLPLINDAGISPGDEASYSAAQNAIKNFKRDDPQLTRSDSVKIALILQPAIATRRMVSFADARSEVAGCKDAGLARLGTRPDDWTYFFDRFDCSKPVNGSPTVFVVIGVHAGGVRTIYLNEGDLLRVLLEGA